MRRLSGVPSLCLSSLMALYETQERRALIREVHSVVIRCGQPQLEAFDGGGSDVRSATYEGLTLNLSSLIHQRDPDVQRGDAPGINFHGWIVANGFDARDPTVNRGYLSVRESPSATGLLDHSSGMTTMPACSVTSAKRPLSRGTAQYGLPKGRTVQLGQTVRRTSLPFPQLHRNPTERNCRLMR
jgi:hypothetical protein